MESVSLVAKYEHEDRPWALVRGRAYVARERGEKNASIAGREVCLEERGSSRSFERAHIIDHRHLLSKAQVIKRSGKGLAARVEDEYRNHTRPQELQAARSLWRLEDEQGVLSSPQEAVLDRLLSRCGSYDGFLINRARVYGLSSGAGGALTIAGEGYSVQEVGSVDGVFAGYERAVRKDYSALRATLDPSRIMVDERAGGFDITVMIPSYVLKAEGKNHLIKEGSFGYRVDREDGKGVLFAYPRVVDAMKNPFVFSDKRICLNDKIAWESRKIVPETPFEEGADNIAFPAYETARVLRRGYHKSVPVATNLCSIPTITDSEVVKRRLSVYENE